MKLHSLFLTILISLLFFTSIIFVPVFIDPLVTAKRFYLFLIFATIIFVISIYHIVKSKPIIIKTTVTDSLIGLFLLYIFIRSFYTPYFTIRNMDFISLVIPISIYFISRYHFARINQREPFVSSVNFKIISYLLLVLVLIQVFTGLLQYGGVLKSFNINFPISGFFNNPGPFAIFLASMLPFTFSFILYKSPNKLLRVIAIIASAGIVIIIMLSASRTSWIAGFIGLTYLLVRRFSLITHFKEWLSSRANAMHRIFKLSACIMLTLVLIVVISYYLFNYKKNSAIGRTFIWKQTVEMIADKPVFGFGFNRFQPEYNNYKVRFFKENSDETLYHQLTGNISYVFNDYLQLAVEFGLTGLFIFIVIYVTIFATPKKQDNIPSNTYNLLTISQACILSVLISAFFSYPLQKIPTMICLYFFTAVAISHSNKLTFNIPIPKIAVRTVAILILPAVVLFAMYELQQIKYYKAWKTAYILKHTEKNDYSLSLYNSIYPKLEHDKYFLYNYSTELSVQGKYRESIPVLKKARNQINDADVLTFLGNNYEGTEQYEKAIEAFEKASDMIPYKFYPKYRLVSLYYIAGKKDKAISIAKQILTMDEKVPSKEVDQIKAEVREFLEFVK